MLWELYQLGRLNQTGAAASQALGAATKASADLASTQHAVHRVEQQVERLTLATIAMMEILRDRYGVTEAELEAKVREIDMRDGKLDGKIAQQRSPTICPACARQNGPARTTCLYCGVPLPVDPMLTP